MLGLPSVVGGPLPGVSRAPRSSTSRSMYSDEVIPSQHLLRVHACSFALHHHPRMRTPSPAAATSLSRTG